MEEKDDYYVTFHCMEEDWKENFLNRLNKCPNKIRKDILKLDPLAIIQLHPFLNQDVSNTFFKNALYKLYPVGYTNDDVAGWITYDMCDLIEAACCDLDTLYVVCRDLVSNRANYYLNTNEKDHMSLHNYLFNYGKYLRKTIEQILKDYGIDYLTKNPDIALGLLNGGESIVAALEEFHFHIYPISYKQSSKIYTGEIQFGIYRPIELLSKKK